MGSVRPPYDDAMVNNDRMRAALVGIFVVLGLFATSCGGGSTDSVTTTDQAAAPTAEASLIASTVDGGQIDFASLEGQDVVLWFWAPW